MHPKSAVAVVNNPTQLLFAIEAADAFSHEVSGLHVVIIPTPGARDAELYGNLVAAAGIRDVDVKGLDSLSRRGRIQDVVRFRHAYNPASRIITPMVNYLPARALLNRAGENAVITDDGSWTLHFASMRNAGASQYRTLLHAALPFGRLPKSLTFFTVYENLNAGRADKTVPNRLTWTKRVFPRGERGTHMVILGSDLARSGYIGEETFVQHVAQLRARCDGLVEYWPHRREDLELAKSMCHRFSMTLKGRTLPLEAEILAVDPSPAIIGTLPSTATRTLRMLKETVGYQIVVSVPKRRDIDPARMGLFEAISRSMQSDADELL